MGERRESARALRLHEALRVAEDVATMWEHLQRVGAGRHGDPPPAWRRDIALMASEEVRRIVWLVESEPRARHFWRIFERQLSARDAAFADLR